MLKGRTPPGGNPGKHRKIHGKKNHREWGGFFSSSRALFDGLFIDILHKYTRPKTNSSHLKMDGWNASFLLGLGLFSGVKLVFLRNLNLTWSNTKKPSFPKIPENPEKPLLYRFKLLGPVGGSKDS